MVIGLTRGVSPDIVRCELTFMERELINYDLAARQHDEYCGLLDYCGVKVEKLPASSDHPDCCFIEDTAIVLDELAVITSMGAASRRGEISAVRKALGKYRELAEIPPSASIEGGDVLRVGRKIFVGRSSRTSAAGIEDLARIATPLGYTVTPVAVRNSLHLTTACSLVGDDAVLINPRWADAEPFKEFDLLYTPDDEPWAANTFRIGGKVCLEAGFPRTIELVHKTNDQVEVLDISEFRKAEAGLSCLSLIFEDTSVGKESKS